MDRTKRLVELARQNQTAYSDEERIAQLAINSPMTASDNYKEYDFKDSDEEGKLINVDSEDVHKNMVSISSCPSDLVENVSPSSSFEDFASSGTEYIPPSESSSSARSDFSTLKVNIDKGFSYSKVKHYLEDLDINTSDTNEEDVTEVQDESNLLIPIAPEILSASMSNINNRKMMDQDAAVTVNTEMGTQEHYKRKKSARERPTICPICFKDVITHFTRHLIRHHKNHKDVILLQALKPGSRQRLALIAALRKQGYFHLNTEKGILNPVRNSKDPTTDYFVCTYCLGHYSKKLLYKHVKTCKMKPVNTTQPGKNCLSRSQTFMASMTSKNNDFLKSSRIKNEVFEIMRPDNISFVAKNDPIICLYGELLLNKHKRQQMSTVVSNKIREIARLLISLRSINTEIQGLFDALKPDTFTHFILATKEISGFNSETKCFKAPSLALHMGTSLKIICDVAFKLVVERRVIPKVEWKDREEKKKEIKELKKLIEGHWCNELSSLALKSLKEKQWQKPVLLPTTNDIQKFQSYLDNRADNVYDKLKNNALSDGDTKLNYKSLTECVLALTVMFNRKRIGDVQYLKINTYTSTSNDYTSAQEAFIDSLTSVEKILSKKFKRVVTGGKGSKPVAILFSTRLQKFIKCLLEVRENSSVVPKSNPYLFASAGSANRWMSGTNIIRKLALDCGATNPLLLTSTRFRKHIATTLQLMNMDDHEMEQIATFMGHTKKTHAEFYRLPQNIYQTAKVAKVLLLMEKGKGREFKGKSVNEIELDKDIYYSSESESEIDEPLILAERALENSASSSSISTAETQHCLRTAIFNDNNVNATKNETRRIPKKQLVKNEDKISGRLRWSKEEKDIVLKHFKRHINNKITPKKHECEELIAVHKDILGSKDWVRVKTLVYNSFRQK